VRRPIGQRRPWSYVVVPEPELSACCVEVLKFVVHFLAGDKIFGGK